MTMQEQLRAAMLAAQSSPVLTNEAPTPTASPDWVEAIADVETESAIQLDHDSSSVVATPDPGNVNAAPVNVSTPQPVRETVKVKNLDEKAVLVQVKRRMYSPYKLDTEESRAYGAGNVNKHLFEGRNNRVKEAISKYTEVYTYAKDNTVPWTTGVELLNIENYMDFTNGLRELIHNADAAVDDLYNKDRKRSCRERV